MEDRKPTLILFRILVHISPVVVGAIVYFALTSIMGLDTKLAAAIAFAFAVIEWVAFSLLLKRLGSNDQ